MSNALAQKLKDKLPKSEPKGPAAKQVRLKLVYIDFMSALKMSFLLGLAQFIVVVIGTFLLYLSLIHI